MKVTRLKPQVLIIIVIFLLIGIIYYSYEVLLWYQHVNANKKVLEDIEEKIVITFDNEQPEYKIDFASLKEQNPDTVAYIKVNNTNISYIVVKGENNSYYLNHNFEQKWNIGGWIFGDYRNRFDETDKNLIIYGHNMKDGSMFDSLSNILNKDWQEKEENHIVTLVTEQGTYQYQVFSTYTIIPEDYYISTDFNSDAEFEKFINTLKSRSFYNYGIEVSKEDKVLTLSSCIGDGRKRVVLHAKLLES